MKRFAAGILLHENKMLLGLRNAGRALFPGVWDIIGGHCEEQEEFAVALFRELKEELGIIPEKYEMFCHIKEAAAFEMQVFVVHSWEGEPVNLCPDEHSDIAWVTPQLARCLKLADTRYLELFEEIKRKYFNR